MGKGRGKRIFFHCCQLTQCCQLTLTCSIEEQNYRRDALVSWQLRNVGFAVLDRSKWDSNIFTVDWSDPEVILECFKSEMKLGVQESPDSVKKCSIPVTGAFDNNASGLKDRFWVSKMVEEDYAKKLEEFSNNIDDSRRIPMNPTAKPEFKDNRKKCKSAQFALSGRFSHTDLHYAEIAIPLIKRLMSKHMPGTDEFRDSLGLIAAGGMVSKKLQPAAVTCLFRRKCQTAPMKRRAQELHMDR